MADAAKDAQTAASQVSTDVQASAEHAAARAESTLQHNWKLVALAGVVAVVALVVVLVIAL